MVSSNFREKITNTQIQNPPIEQHPDEKSRRSKEEAVLEPRAMFFLLYIALYFCVPTVLFSSFFVFPSKFCTSYVNNQRLIQPFKVLILINLIYFFSFGLNFSMFLLRRRKKNIKGNERETREKNLGVI